MSDDVLTRIINNELNVRAYAVVTLDTVRDIAARHGAHPVAALTLARVINATALLSATLKPDSNQTLSLKISGSGPLGEIHVQADALGNVRAYIANPNPDIVEIDGIGFDDMIGAGFLTVIKDLGLKEPYYSMNPLQQGDIASEVAHYLTFSEQIPSALILGVKLDDNLEIVASGGILIQVYPGTERHIIAEIDNRITSNKSSLGDHLQAGGDIHSFLAAIFGGSPPSILHTSPIRHRCRCSREMLRNIVTGLARKEITEMITKDGGAEIECTFCRTRYHYPAEELAQILAEKGEDS